MKKLTEVFEIEVHSDGEPLTAWVSRERYPSKEEIEEAIRMYDADYANVVKLYTLEEETN